jgi:hypothetical protein
LTAAERSKSLAPAGTRAREVFHFVYRFENEQLLELINRTAHAAALGALVEKANAYRFYFGCMYKSVGRFTMAGRAEPRWPPARRPCLNVPIGDVDGNLSGR